MGSKISWESALLGLIAYAALIYAEGAHRKPPALHRRAHSSPSLSAATKAHHKPAASFHRSSASKQESEKDSGHAKWRKFPLAIYFVRDESYTESRARIARTAFSRWVEATNGFVSFRETDKQSAAQVTVRFDPATFGGLTLTHYRASRLALAEVTIGVASEEPSDIGCNAAHEFGHALGLDTHSDEMSDIMYPVHELEAPWGITRHDLATLATLYKASAASSDWTPIAGL